MLDGGVKSETTRVRRPRITDHRPRPIPPSIERVGADDMVQLASSGPGAPMQVAGIMVLGKDSRLTPHRLCDALAARVPVGEYAHNGAARAFHRGDDDDGFEPTIMRGRE